MTRMILFVICAIMIFSCHTPDPMIIDPPIVVKDTIFDLKWKENLASPYREIVVSRYVQVYKNWYITTGDVGDPGLVLYAFDINTGEKVWEWHHSGKVKDYIRKMRIKDNVLVMDTGPGLMAIDLDTRAILWETNHYETVSGYGVPLNIIGDYAYKYLSKGNFNYPDEAFLLRFKVNTGAVDTVYSVPEEGVWAPQLSGPAIWVDPMSKDSIIVFVNSRGNINKSPQDSPTDLYAVNLRTKKLVWKQTSFCEVSTSMNYQPVIYGDDVLVGGDWSIYSYDIPTGKLNWRRPFDKLKPFGSFNNTQHLLVGDRIYVNPDVFDVMCIHAGTGEVLWHNETDAPNCTPNMIYHEDMLIFTSWGYGSVMILDGITGKLIHRERAYDDSPFSTNVVYHQNSDMFFTQNYKQAFGFKIRKPK
ncbi:MAG: PQQ-binding-like beta-propeller repeat protein [Saprospiraceae bacterium]